MIIEPMLPCEVENAAHAERLIRSPLWAAQEKMDGVRALVTCAGNTVSAVSRNGRPLRLDARIAAALAAADLCVVLDCEVVGSVLHVFDIYDEPNALECVRGIFIERAKLLEFYAKKEFVGEHVRVVPTAYSRRDKAALAAKVRERLGEGLVFKRLGADYVHGRTADALKWKFTATATVRVSGLHPQKNSAEIQCLDGESFVCVGHVRTMDSVPLHVGQLIEVKYLYFVKSLVQPIFIDVRTDKSEPDCVCSLKKRKR